MDELAALELRVTALERRNTEIGDVTDLVDLLRDVRGALRLFVKLGNGLKWFLGLGVSIVGAYYAVKHWLAG